MRLETWSSEAHLPIIQGWADTDEYVREVLGQGAEITDALLDQNCRERVVVFSDDDPVAMFGWNMMGPALAVVHVVGTPEWQHGLWASGITKACEVVEDHLRESGVKVLYLQIPEHLKTSIKLALHMGFTEVKNRQFVKGLV